jgi:hypothetical protein
VKKTDTADRQDTTGEGVTKQSPGAGIQDREYKVAQDCVTNNCSSAR